MENDEPTHGPNIKYMNINQFGVIKTVSSGLNPNSAKPFERRKKRKNGSRKKKVKEKRKISNTYKARFN